MSGVGLYPNGIPSNRKTQYGQKGTIKYNPSNDETQSGIRQTVTLVDWSSPDGVPRDVTVEIGVISGSGNYPTRSFLQVVGGVLTAFSYSYRARAQVIIGQTGSMQDIFYLDINRGQRFTTSASYVAITAEALPPPSGPLFTRVVPGSMTVTAGLGYGACRPLAPVLYTQYIDGISASTNPVTFQIPPRANFLLPILVSDNTVPITISENAPGIGTIGQFTFVSGQMTAAVPLAQDADQISFLYPVGASTISSRLVFQLSL